MNAILRLSNWPIYLFAAILIYMVYQEYRIGKPALQIPIQAEVSGPRTPAETILGFYLARKGKTLKEALGNPFYRIEHLQGGRYRMECFPQEKGTNRPSSQIHVFEYDTATKSLSPRNANAKSLIAGK